MQVDRGRVLQGLELLDRRAGDLGMAVADADGDDAGEAIQITPPRLVVEILHRAFDDHDGVLVVGDQRRGQMLPAQAQGVCMGRAVVGPRLMVERRQLGPAGLGLNVAHGCLPVLVRVSPPCALSGAAIVKRRRHERQCQTKGGAKGHWAARLREIIHDRRPVR